MKFKQFRREYFAKSHVVKKVREHRFRFFDMSFQVRRACNFPAPCRGWLRGRLRPLPLAGTDPCGPLSLRRGPHQPDPRHHGGALRPRHPSRGRDGLPGRVFAPHRDGASAQAKVRGGSDPPASVLPVHAAGGLEVLVGSVG